MGGHFESNALGLILRFLHSSPITALHFSRLTSLDLVKSEWQLWERRIRLSGFPLGRRYLSWAVVTASLGHERSSVTVRSRESALLPRMALGAIRAANVLMCANRQVCLPHGLSGQTRAGAWRNTTSYLGRCVLLSSHKTPTAVSRRVSNAISSRSVTCTYLYGRWATGLFDSQ